MHWLKDDTEYLVQQPLVAFDTETTGLWAPANKIVEIGAVKFALGGRNIKRFQSLVNPERPIPPETIEIHGITDSMVQNAPTVQPVLAEFFEFCGDKSVLIAHNALFDIGFVGCECDRFEIPMPQNSVLDTVEIFRKYRPGLNSYSLLSLATRFKLASEQQHRAADDAAMVWKLFELVAEDFPSLPDEGAFRREFSLHRFDEWEGETREPPEQYNELITAMENRLAVTITYQSNGRTPQQRIIHPRRFHYLRSRHYVTAYCELAQAERTFRLDRIVSFSLGT